MKRILRNAAALFAAGTIVLSALAGCTSGSEEAENTAQTNGSGDDSSTNSNNGTSGANSASSTTDAWSGWKDFNDSSSWVNITIDKSYFSSFEAGCKIDVYLTKDSSASYNKLKFNYQGSSWTEMTGGSYTNGTYDSTYGGVEPNGATPLSYTVTASDATNLKSY